MMTGRSVWACISRQVFFFFDSTIVFAAHLYMHEWTPWTSRSVLLVPFECDVIILVFCPLHDMFYVIQDLV